MQCHSPSTNDGIFIDLITKVCDILVDMRHVIVVGDFNIDK